MGVKDDRVDEKLENTTQSEKIATKRKSSRKRNIAIFIVVSLLNVGLLVLLWSQLLTPAQNQKSSKWPNCS